MLRQNVKTKLAQKLKKHISCSVTFFSEIRAVYEIIWKNTVERGRPQIKIWHMRIACWIPKATNTHSEYVILITFPQQQWLHESASMLCYTYIARLPGTRHHGDMNHEPRSIFRTQNIRHHSTKCSRHGYRASRIYAPLTHVLILRSWRPSKCPTNF